MTQRALIARVCLYNLVFYAALFVVLLSNPQWFGPLLERAAPAAAPSRGDGAVVSASTEAELAGRALLDALRQGGHVLFFRHFMTTKRDALDDLYKDKHIGLRPEAFDDCSWQRPLSDFGVRSAREAGQALAALGVPIGEVHASPYCRTVESAVLLFGREPRKDPRLVFRNDGYPAGAANRHLLERYLNAPPKPGTNTVVVGHRPPMDALGGIEEGEAMVFRHAGARLYLVARVPAHGWKLATFDPESLAARNDERRPRRGASRYFAPPKAKESYPPVEQLLAGGGG